MNFKTRYVLGFIFFDDCVLLAEKTRGWQAGKWNGIGGHIEEYDESPIVAMTRECLEETDLITNIADWQYYARMISIVKSYECFVFRWFATDIDASAIPDTTDSDEILQFAELKELHLYELLPNVNWLVQLALDTEPLLTTIHY